MRVRLAAGLVLVLVGVSPAFAQMLADVARKEEARRGTVAAPAKVYTNGDLTSDFTTPPAKVEYPASSQPPTGSPAGNASANAPSAQASPAAEPVAKTDEELKAEAKAKEEFWRKQATRIRARIDKARVDIEAATGPPAANAKEQARIDAVLKKFTDALNAAESDLEVLQTRANAAGIPKAWIQ